MLRRKIPSEPIKMAAKMAAPFSRSFVAGFQHGAMGVKMTK
jgi:hypothetical protein